MLAAHRREHDRFLQGAAVGRRRLRTERGVAEQMGEFPARIVVLAAVRALGTSARGIAQRCDQLARSRIALCHPRREHRIAARDAQPREHVRERPQRIVTPDVMGDERGEPRRADLARDNLRQPLADLGARRTPGAPHLQEKGRQRAFRPSGHQVMQARGLLRALVRQVRKGIVLVLEQPQAKLRVAHGIAAAVADELVVLDQSVIGVLRKGDR